MAQLDNLSPTAPPTIQALSPWEWVQKNLFSTWYNAILTIVCLLILGLGLTNFLSWVLGGAEWAVVRNNLALFMVGRYPQELYWRVWLSLATVVLVAGLSWGFYQRAVRLWSRPTIAFLVVAVAAAVLLPIGLPSRFWIVAQIAIAATGVWVGRRLIDPKAGGWLPLGWVFSFIVALWLIKGGLGLEPTRTNEWNGLLLTLLAAFISIVLSFPLGVLLALGRQSALPIVRWFSILYIELIRGTPLIVILFFSQTLLQLFLPPEYPRIDGLLRALIGLLLFSAAYLAEDVRGGLQSVPRGQAEAASALGLNAPLVILLIVMPQALKAVIPAIVGQFIALFKDTSLLALYSLNELLGISQSILANPKYLGDYAEVYLFLGLVYGVFCYAMAAASQRLERTLNVGQR